MLTGRAKDTIVLSSGENIEPSCIEDAVVCSPLIKFCVLLGQDRRSLGALVVLDTEAVEDMEKEKGVIGHLPPLDIIWPKSNIYGRILIILMYPRRDVAPCAVLCCIVLFVLCLAVLCCVV